MKIPKVVKALSLAFGLLIIGVPRVQAQEFVIKVQSVGDVKYANGGFGLEEQEAMRNLASEFNLRLMFSTSTRGAFVANAALTVTDMKGTAVFELAEAGPLTHVLLPSGKYRVSATYKGVTEMKTVSLVGKQPRNLYFRWKAEPDAEPAN